MSDELPYEGGSPPPKDRRYDPSGKRKPKSVAIIAVHRLMMIPAQREELAQLAPSVRTSLMKGEWDAARQAVFRQRTRVHGSTAADYSTIAHELKNWLANAKRQQHQLQKSVDFQTGAAKKAKRRERSTAKQQAKLAKKAKRRERSTAKQQAKLAKKAE